MAPLACPYCRIALAPPDTWCPRDGHPGEEVAWDVIPPALGKRFSVLEPFARGGTGSLYVADESESGRRGLLKILTGVPKHREPERARLRRELAKQASLPQSRLVVPWASGETEGVSWLFRPWLDGVSLRVRLHQGDRLPTDDALAIGAQLAIALDDLHRGGLLHRDLRPGHVFLPTGSTGPVRAQLIEAGVCASLVRPGNSTIFGTPGYVAPEQLSGKLVSFRSDLYSLGCVMYEMLAGRPPFPGKSDQQVLAAQLSGELPELPEDLPDGIAALLRSLLSREPQERPFSAQKLRRILDPYAPDGSSMNRQPTSTFATVPHAEPTENAERADKAVERPAASAAPAALPSVPPPPPPAALKSAKPGAQPRPTTRGMAPPPPPRRQQNDDGDESAISVDMLEEVEASVPPPPPAPAETTQELSADHLFDIRRAPPASEQPAAHRPPKDATVPIRLEQILAIAPARMRSNAPPLPEPEPEPAPAAADPIADERSKKTSGFPQPALQLGQLSQLSANSQMRGPDSDAPAATMENSLFGTLPTSDDAQRAHAARADHADETTVTPAAELPDAWDEDAARTLAMAAESIPGAPTQPRGSASGPRAQHVSSLQSQRASDERSATDESDPQALRETLPPWLSGPLGGYRKLAYIGAAAAALVLGVFGMRAILGHDEDELAAAQAAPPGLAGSGPTVVPVPAVEPAPSVEPLAKPPQHGSEKPAPRTEEVPAQALASAPEPAKAPEPSAPEPTAVPAVEIKAGAEPAPPPAGPAPQPVEARAAAEAAPATAPSAKSAENEKPQPRVTREDRRRERRERRERELAEKKAAKAEARAAKASAASNDRETKWAEARDLARSHYAAKRYRQSAQAYELAAQYDPTNAGTFAGLGAARLQAGDARGAIAAYQRAIQLSPSTSGFHAALGRAYVAVGDRAKAKAAYQRALSLDPNNVGAKTGLKEIGG